MWDPPDNQASRGLVYAIEQALYKRSMLGVCIGVSYKGERYYFRTGRRSTDSADPLSIESQFDLLCLIKVLGAAVVLELGSRGRLDLQASIGEYLSEFADTPKGSSIKVVHLLSHTSGHLAINTHSGPMEGLFTRVLDSPQLFNPGDVFSYQNANAVLLASIVSRVCGKSLVELVESRLVSALRQCPDERIHRVVGHYWSPRLGQFMKSSVRLGYGELWEPAWCTGLALSVPELTALSELLLGTEVGTRNETLAFHSEVASSLQKQVVEIPRGTARSEAGFMPVSYGCGLAGYSRGALGHDGTSLGQSVGLRIVPEAELCVVVAMNCNDPTAVRQALFDAVFDAFAIEADGAHEYASLPCSLSDLEGSYLGRESLWVDVMRSGQDLVLSMRDGDRKLIEMAGSVDETGYFHPRSKEGTKIGLAERLCYTFFQEPGSGTPCLMSGVTALKKLESAPPVPFGD